MGRKISRFFYAIMPICVFVFLFLNFVAKSEARIRTTVDLDWLIEESELICEVEAGNIVGTIFPFLSKRNERTQAFKIRKILKGRVGRSVIKVTYPDYDRNCALDAEGIEFGKNRKYILFLRSDNSGKLRLTFDQRESIWPKYKEKDRMREFFYAEHPDKLSLKTQLVYEIGQLFLNPRVSSSKKREVLDLIIHFGANSSEYKLFSSEYAWFMQMLKKVIAMGGYFGYCADEFVNLSEGRSAGLSELGGKIYIDTVVDDIENVKKSIETQLNDVFPVVSFNVFYSQDDDVKIIRFIINMPESSEHICGHLEKQLINNIKAESVRFGNGKQWNCLELNIRDKGEL